jgi:hypothetical protein
LRVVVWLLTAVVGGVFIIVIGRGLGCAFRGGCEPSEWRFGAEILGGLAATLAGLFYVLTKKG